ncbi:MAG: class IV adenylate cyclase [Acidimicrobiia bacterium]|nr:class IV adenylate cyclase [Acidimicrobiia bacterium]
MPAPRYRETEIKLALADAAIGRKLLKAAGFACTRKRALESNVLLDTSDGRLRRDGRLIRLRWTAGACLLTYKGPPKSGRHKSRQEIEVDVGDGKAMQVILEQLGFLPSYRYEKYRSEYRRSSEAGVATLDETPVGVFFELEGSPSWIDKAAKSLGFRRSDYITKSYATLWGEQCEEAGKLTGKGMAFPPSHTSSTLSKNT